ncbi:MAG: methylmalonyl Co-A mutase-associated GTPase MeaB, partial [Bacteroidetes bacterium HGW-Bacteroidetes-22]
MEGKERKFKSALKVNEGIEQPPQVNADYVKNLKHKRALLPVDEYFRGILAGNRTILSQAITLVESSLPDHHRIAQQLVERCLPYTGNSIRLGITGVPGAGKSTFIEAFGKFLTRQDHRVAVLAIDPSSQRSKGSILGDKTRMEELSTDRNAFIRPSPSAGSLGGVARKTRETTVLCEAAGFDIIIIETVGVGQSETAVHSMVDFFLLLMLSGAGDELQGIKRGIMEMADAIIIN